MALQQLFQKSDFLDVRRLLFFLAIAASLAMTGPFGTFYLPLLTRATYWTLWLMMIWAPTVLIFGAAQRGPLTTWMPSWTVSTGVFIISWPIVAFCAVSLASQFFADFPLTLGNVIAEAKVLWPVLFALVLLLHFTHRKAEVVEAGEEQPIAFLKRLPAKLGQKLISISSADHYLQVKTEQGETLILLSLKQAEEELNAYPGLRVHRGHWVALDAVTQKIWRDSRLFLELKDGAEVPVGRSYRSQVLAQL
ncbi:LytTR family transcriptional regulator [Maritalea mobilis]|uniref:LytTR family transcriptional regulator n=1 Tax=Maritalea mobilis TaxID=483324 RepID=A0A4R6VV66_9HYPH|nr:LytTR family DNA-binding domain-containing protein [Maritalea mobilis]TDQ64131.1 LytTR family transcriptional regulator [Maritalea mobilis]